jgi:hypothetical protein
MVPSSYIELKRCRVSASEHLVTVLHLGVQALTGVFPGPEDGPVTAGPLELVWCPDSGLLQLKHSYNPAELYGDNYGYRSGLNQSMVRHLESKTRYLERVVGCRSGDVVLDIGSNDGTLLKSYKTGQLEKVGIDPTAAKFKRYYTPDIQVVSDFFSRANFEQASSKKAKIVTSIAMIYDLEDPVHFAREVRSILDGGGVWHFEQSYMPSMLRTNSYDTICHEHLEYYSLTVVKRIVEAAGMRVIDVQMNSVNGGSFAVTAARDDSLHKANDAMINWLLEQESRMGLNTPRPFRDFEERVFRHRDDLRRLVRALVKDGRRILGYGASTKGNVLLQFCGFTPDDIPAIADVNPDKFGCVTPGTHIPIVSEAAAREMNPDFFLVLPWHFKAGILEREKDFLLKGGKLILPFPEIEVI